MPSSVAHAPGSPYWNTAMRGFFVFLVVFFLLVTTAQPGEKTQPIPIRFQNITKNTRCELIGVWGRREQDPAWGHTASFSADGKLALFTSATGTDKGDAAFFLAQAVALVTVLGQEWLDVLFEVGPVWDLFLLVAVSGSLLLRGRLFGGVGFFGCSFMLGRRSIGF